MTIVNSTIVNNSSASGAGGVLTASNFFKIKNSIVANNSGGNCSIPSGSASGTNFDTDGTCPGFTQVTSADLNLGSLQLNSPGTTATHALLAGSVAIDAATDCTLIDGTTPVTEDQRGVPRPQGPNCDVGAYEARSFTLTITGAGTGGGTVTNSGINCTVSSGSTSGDCSETVPEGTSIPLTATPDGSSVFAGWSGDPDCSDGQVIMDAGKTCTATFNDQSNPSSAVFAVRNDGTVSSDRAFFCGLAQNCFNTGLGADLAERIWVTEPVEPGDVVEIDPHHPGKYRKARGPFSPRVAGVIATSPGITLANDPGEQRGLLEHLEGYSLWTQVGPRPWVSSAVLLREAGHPTGSWLGLSALLDPKGERSEAWGGVAGILEAKRTRLALERLLSRPPGQPFLALMGRVWVKATAENGPIAPGDLLTTASKPGYVMRCSRLERCGGALVGKALTALREGEGLIEALVLR